MKLYTQGVQKNPTLPDDGCSLSRGRPSPRHSLAHSFGGVYLPSTQISARLQKERNLAHFSFLPLSLNTSGIGTCAIKALRAILNP